MLDHLEDILYPLGLDDEPSHDDIDDDELSTYEGSHYG